ncbi:hypothetical protein [Paludibacter sp.]|uniref:hypothetical protein n=1 Tax=Paludibacter sp. TaxID=1898105 RepID=UPI0013526E4E|nr:hypothetical protein [Paludibacter sp.]MTK53318.1 hypothetical protein [Paludibacter sp.]
MYKVRVIYQPVDPTDETNKFQKGVIEGIYVEKDRQHPPAIAKIKKQVWEYIQPRIFDKKRPQIIANLIEITVKKLPEEFIVCEDKS